MMINVALQIFPLLLESEQCRQTFNNNAIIRKYHRHIRWLVYSEFNYVCQISTVLLGLFGHHTGASWNRFGDKAWPLKGRLMTLGLSNHKYNSYIQALMSRSVGQLAG